MAVAFDAATTSTGSGSRSFAHTPVGTPAAVILLIGTTSSSDVVTAALYGISAMTEITGSPLLKGTGEAMSTYAYFLGASVPTGMQTVTVTITGAIPTSATVITLTASGDVETVDIDVTINSDSLENPSVTLGLGGRTCFCCITFGSGHDAATSIAPLSNWTSISEADAGTQQISSYRYDIIGTTDVTAGFTQTAEDAQMIALAVSEIAVAGGSIGPLVNGGLVNRGRSLVNGGLVA